MTIEHLARTLANEPDSPARLTDLKGGYWNRVYRYQSDKDWVIKEFNTAADSVLFPIIPEAEAGTLKFLAGTGIAPEFVDYIEPSDTRATTASPVLVYEFAKGRPWQGDSDRDYLEAGQLLQRLHSLDLSRFDQLSRHSLRQLPCTGKTILHQAESILARVRNQSTEAFCHLQKLSLQLDHQHSVPPLTQVLVHTDCGPGNMIRTDKGLCLIDWQCPGLGDPCHDLSVFLSPGIHILYDLPATTAAQRAVILEGYQDQQILDRLQQVQPFYHYLLAAYFIYRAESLRDTSPIDADKYQDALQHELELLDSLATEKAFI